MVISTNPADGQNIRVLVVDENPLFLRVTTGFLQRQAGLAGFRTAASIGAALAEVRDFQPAVIVLDPSTKGLNGLWIIPRLRAMLPNVRIIVLALIDSPTYREAALNVGADGFVSKSDMVTDLLPAIRRAGHGSSIHSEAGELPAGYSLDETTVVGRSAD